MRISFDKIREMTIPHLNQGKGAVSAKMFVEGANKIMVSRLPAGSSIGMHQHTASFEVNYVLSGMGKAICDGKDEELQEGVCHYCPARSSHSIINTGQEELVLFTVVSEQA